MYAQVIRTGLLMAFVLSLLIVPTAIAAPPSEQLLPPTTKGFVSVPDVDLLRERWDEMQLGQLMKDPLMKSFVDDLKRQLRDKLKSTSRLGIDWDDLEGVYGGEVSVAIVQPWDRRQEEQAVAAAVAKVVQEAQAAGRSKEYIDRIEAKTRTESQAQQDAKRRAEHAVVMLVDVTGHEEQARELLAKLDREFAAREATKTSQKVAGVPMTVYTLPKQRREKTARQVFLAIHQDRLIAVDHEGVAAEILARLDGQQGPSLAEVQAFSTAMTRCGEAFGDAPPQLRWFVEPFGYVEVMRAYNGGRTRRGTDVLKVLANQGFTAIQGLGGYIALATDDLELIHRTVVYAPPVKRAEDDPSTEKYDLAARMLDFPNGLSLTPERFVPRDLSMYVTFNWKVQKAFYAAETLVNEIAGDEVFRDVLESIKTDPNGPQIDIERELVAFLGERATLISDYRMPVTPKSERLLFAVEVTDANAVRRTVDKAMASDPAAKRIDVGNYIIWEIINEDPVDFQELQIDGDFAFQDFAAPAEEAEDKPVIPNSAVTVAHGHLIVASHVDYIVDILKERKEDDQLTAAMDFNLVQAALGRLGAGQNSFNFFTRTDEAYRVTYELIRQGRMPESESLLGKLLNRIWEPEEEDELREQFIDGNEMPDYQLVRRYLGPGGFFVRSEEDGWTIVGCLMTKEAP